MNHELCRGRVTSEDPADGAVYAALFSSVDPTIGARPGDEMHLALSVAPDASAHLGFAYLLADSLKGVATVVSLQDIEMFPHQGWYRVRAEQGQTSTGYVTVQIVGRPKAPRLRPQIAISVSGPGGRGKVRVGRLGHEAVPVRSSVVPGLRMVTDPGVPASVHALDALAGQGLPIAVTHPRHGMAELSADGWIHYRPAPGFAGYDRFEYSVGTAAGEKIDAPVNVFVGRPVTPGVFPDIPGSTSYQHWQWPRLSGEMPWPGRQQQPLSG